LAVLNFFTNHQTQPNAARNAEKVNKQQCAGEQQNDERQFKTPSDDPMQDHEETQTEKGKNDVRNKHGTVVKAWFREIRLVTLVTILGHFKRLFEGERACIEQITLPTTGTMHAENTTQF
jgi:hypothetical protein